MKQTQDSKSPKFKFNDDLTIEVGYDINLDKYVFKYILPELEFSSYINVEDAIETLHDLEKAVLRALLIKDFESENFWCERYFCISQGNIFTDDLKKPSITITIQKGEEDNEGVYDVEPFILDKNKALKLADFFASASGEQIRIHLEQKFKK